MPASPKNMRHGVRRLHTLPSMVRKSIDEFKPQTRNRLAMRAGYRCSMRGCGVLTIGPSDEAADATTNIGVAAHIHAAAPGGRRFDPQMSSEERSDIRNGIWLCSSHSVEIDRDETRYTPALLIEMKEEHERSIAEELNTGQGFLRGADLVAIGPDIAVLGELLGSSARAWNLRIDHFVQGNIRTLIAFIEGFKQRDPFDCFLVVNALGDGRQLAGEPTWRRAGRSLECSFPIRARFPIEDANALAPTLSSSASNDLVLEKGDLAMVSGIASLPQRIKQALSYVQGESKWNPKAGSRLKEFFDDFGDSPWLERWMKLDVIRLACVPYLDFASKRPYTLIPSVRYVEAVEILPGERRGDWQSVRLKLEVEGIGPWENVVPVFMPAGSGPVRPAGSLSGKAGEDSQ